MNKNDLVPQITLGKALTTLCDLIYKIMTLINGPLRAEEEDEIPGIVFDSAVHFGLVPAPDEPEDYDDPTFVELGAWYVKKPIHDEFMAIIASALRNPSKVNVPIPICPASVGNGESVLPLR